MKCFQIFVAILQQYHKIKGHRSSGLLLTFWLMITFCSIAQLRWEVNNFNTSHFGNDELTWEGFQFINYVTFFSFICIMLLANSFSDKPPKNSTYPKATNPSPEIKASMLNRAFFAFFDRTAWIGWRKSLVVDDIYDINPQNASRELVPEFDKSFHKNIEKQKR